MEQDKQAVLEALEEMKNEFGGNVAFHSIITLIDFLGLDFPPHRAAQAVKQLQKEGQIMVSNDLIPRLLKTEWGMEFPKI